MKRAPAYPDHFLDDCQAVTYFKGYFDWYNNEHYHSAIDFVTPHQAHEGLREKIVTQRRSQHRAQRRKRRTENQQQKTTTEKTRNHNPSAASLVV